MSRARPGTARVVSLEFGMGAIIGLYVVPGSVMSSADNTPAGLVAA
jgi:hypothetical protein